MNPYIRIIFYQSFLFYHIFIHISIFKNPKTHFFPSIKGFQSLKGVWKRLINSFYSRIHLPFINHFCFLYLKTPKIFLDFKLLTFLFMDSISTHHYSNLKFRFEELSIMVLICDFAHSMTLYLCILHPCATCHARMSPCVEKYAVATSSVMFVHI